MTVLVVLLLFLFLADKLANRTLSRRGALLGSSAHGGDETRPGANGEVVPAPRHENVCVFFSEAVTPGAARWVTPLGVELPAAEGWTDKDVLIAIAEIEAL